MEKTIRVPFGGGWAEARPPAAATIWLLEPALLPPLPEPAVISRALGTAGIDKAWPLPNPTRARPLTIIVNDATRPTPSGRILAHLVERGLLPAQPAPGSIRVLVATGSHRPGGEDDVRHILNGLSEPRWPELVEWHDARDAHGHVSVGTTSRGTPVGVDRRVVEAGSLLLINSVEPHYFAGYTGGRKSLVPGVAAYDTIEVNHRLALQAEADVLCLTGNPMHEDAEEALALLPLPQLLSLQVVLDQRQQVACMAAGDLPTTFAAAVVEADRRYVAPLPRPVDIVVSAAAPPMDYDLYQSQKAVDNAARALRDGGVLILVSSCRHGIGDRGYFELLASSADPTEAQRRIAEHYVLGYHKANRLAAAAGRINIFSVTHLPNATARAAFFQPFADLQTALDAAVARTGATPGIHVAVLPDGCVTVPRVLATKEET